MFGFHKLLQVIKSAERVLFVFIVFTCKFTSMDMNNWKDQRAFFVCSDSEILIQGIGNTSILFRTICRKKKETKIINSTNSNQSPLDTLGEDV